MWIVRSYGSGMSGIIDLLHLRTTLSASRRWAVLYGMNHLRGQEIMGSIRDLPNIRDIIA